MMAHNLIYKWIIYYLWTCVQFHEWLMYAHGIISLSNFGFDYGLMILVGKAMTFEHFAGSWTLLWILSSHF